MTDFVTRATNSASNSIRVPNDQYFGVYRGIVVNNNDPKERGRCKVYVPTVYHEKFKENGGKLLPWAEPAQPLFAGGKGDDGANGTFQCPDLDSTVLVLFESGDTARPIMFALLTDKNGKFSTKHCRIKWEKMWIDLERDGEANTNTITIHADTTLNEEAVNADINATAGNNINTKAAENINATAGTTVVVDAGTSITLTAPSIKLSGSSSVSISAPIITIDGGSGDAKISGVSLVNHTHVVPPHCPSAGSTNPPTQT